MNYSTVISDARIKVPGFEKKYKDEVNKGYLDESLGPHSVFSLVFLPILENAIDSNDPQVSEMFSFMENMAVCGDSDVAEVLEFTILEQLCDDYDDEQLISFMGKETAKSQEYIRRYTLGPSGYRNFRENNTQYFPE